jgi:hypothetical protein
LAKARIEIHPAAGLGPIGTKNPPIDADKSLYLDSTAGDAAVTSTWAQIKAFLKTYFDTLYAAIGLAHTRLHSITSILDHSSTATPGQILKANANGLPVDATNTDADVADAVAKRHTQGTDTALGVVGIKNPPIDADKALYRDSTAGDALVTSTWTQVKAFLKTYFDTIYGAIGLAHARQHAITSVSDHTSAATPGKMLKADANGLPIDASNTDAEVASAVSLKHTQGTDTALGAVGTKDPPIDADKVLERNSAAGDALVTTTWTQIKAFLKTYFDTIYAALTHASRHQWLGADQVNIKDLFFQFVALYYKLWSDLNGFTSLVSGSGSNTTGFSYLSLWTGATINSVAGAYATQNYWLAYSDGNYRYRVMARHNPQSVTTTSEYWFGILNVPATPSYTQKHIAFQILNGEIWASCGDGVNGTQVDTGVALGATGTADLYFKYMGSDIKYYVGGVLKATITTNRPNNWQGYFTTYLTNSAASTRNMLIYPAIILIGPE